MNTCTQVQRSLSRYLDNELSASERASIESHVVACASCSQELAQLKRAQTLTASMPRKVLPPDYLVDRLRDAIAVEKRSRRGFSLSSIGLYARRLIPVPVTAILIAALMLAFSPGEKTTTDAVQDVLFGSTVATTETAAAVLLGVHNE